MRLVKAIFVNRAPFEQMTLDFDDSNLFLLIGVNGKGKTTILSYIVDSFYELAKKSFHNEFEEKPNKFYRVSSGINAIDGTKPSIVYLRYLYEGKYYDYVDIMGDCDESTYNLLIQLPNRIPYRSIKSSLEQTKVVKHWNLDDKKAIEKLFDEELHTYFPSYRFEMPHYLNDPYKINVHFKLQGDFNGYLKNPIEVSSSLEKDANWIMDIILDDNLYHQSASNVLHQLNSALNSILVNKTGEFVRLGIGPRHQSAQRISIVRSFGGTTIYPSIFSMSSGEKALFCLFAELIRQADAVGQSCNEIKGIVLIDEIDKNLHIKLQNEVLPNLLKMFPNVQFIVTSHAPFFSMGLAQSSLVFRTFDFDNGGLECVPLDNHVFKEAYDLLISENNRYADLYKALTETIAKSTKPLIITEGKTDWKHIKASIIALNIDDLDVSFYEYDGSMGDEELLKCLENYSHIGVGRKVIGVFDRDNGKIIEKICSEKSDIKDFGNGVFAFCIPVANEDEYGNKTSIEHYYKKNNLLKENQEGRRLFLGKEFYSTSGNSSDGYYQTRISNLKNKVDNNGIIDEKVYLKTDLKCEKSIALSKSDFADLIYNKDPFCEGFDFSEFNKILDIIKGIILK